MKHMQVIYLIVRPMSTLAFVILTLLGMPMQAIATPLGPIHTQDTHAELMTHVLTAEIALTRNQPELALKEYLEATRMSTDPAIAQQTTLLAIQLEKPKEAIESATLWARKAPDNLQAQLVASTLLIGISSNDALPFLDRAIEIAPEDTDKQLASIQSRLSEQSRKQLGEALRTVAKNRPKDAYAHLIAAHQAAYQEDIENANTWVDSALELSPQLTKAIELKARLIRFTDNTDVHALNYLLQKITDNPKNSELRLFYANALLDANRSEEAVEQLNHITEDKEFGGQALLLLAEYHFKNKQLNKASDELLKAVSFKDTEETAHYLLGQLLEHQHKTKAAIEQYTAVTKGPDHISAFIKAATLLSEQKNYEEAIALLHSGTPESLEEEKQLILTELDVLMNSNQLENAMTLADNVLSKIPNDIDMRFKHSLLATQLNRLNVAEMDLKIILQINPNHVQALSALGILLGNQQNREREAIGYLSRALELEPNNPESLDMIGWLYYKTGDIQQAIVNLKKAYQQSPNAKIAAHLDEVLKKQSH